MSRAFVKEDAGEHEDFPERLVSAQPNFVTARGLRLIEENTARLEQEREQARAADDSAARVRIERDLRYWQQRKGSAKLVLPEAAPVKARFGVTVVLSDARGSELSYTLVGEDEAEPQKGLISWTSPVAQMLLGRDVGEEVELQGGRYEITALESRNLD